jgi:hypothetical protein
VVEKKCERTSKYHTKGDIYQQPTTMDGKKFEEMLKNQLIPAICQQVPWAEEVIVQMDNAGGHRVQTSVPRLNEYVKETDSTVVVFEGERKRIPIVFVTQPARSPDLNVLDLGAWNLLQAIVPVVKYERNPKEKIYTRIIRTVLKAWDEWAAAEKLGKLFCTLYEVCQLIMKHKGGSRFLLPHYTKAIYKQVADVSVLLDEMDL